MVSGILGLLMGLDALDEEKNTENGGIDPAQMAEVQFAPHVIERMQRGAVLYPDSETGEALVGVMEPLEKKGLFPRIYVLETIPPREAVRQWAMFSQGDDWQGSVFNWLHENWEVYRTLRRRSYGKDGKWDLPLLHVGDWHKQPGMVAPSWGDFRTAKQFLKDNEREFLLAPIVTLADESAHSPAAANTLIYQVVNPAVRIDFWGIGRKDRRFLPLKPIVAVNYELPRLPDAVWWLQDSERMDLEIAALEKDGLTVLDIAQYNADEIPPLETCFALYRPGGYKVILVITPHTYPKKAPTWRLAPILRPQVGKDFFKMLFEASEPLPASVTSHWSGHSHALIDGVRMVERHLQEQKPS